MTSDEGDGDDWPALRSKILAHDILVFGGPIWMGQIGSVAKRVLERMDAFLTKPTRGPDAELRQGRGRGDRRQRGRRAFPTAQLFQSLNDTGWTIPAVARCYWVGEAMGKVDFRT